MSKTESLPGMEQPVIPAITEAAEQYATARDNRMAMLKTEIELKNALIALLHEHKLTTYRDDNCDPPLSVELRSTEKVKVKIGSDEPEPGEDEEE